MRPKEMELYRPMPLKKGDGIGIFTPSWPANALLSTKYEMGIAHLSSLGFHVIEGSLTKGRSSEGYRSASPQLRAAEMMELIENPHVKCLMATIGGNNSSSLIPYLDFKKIRKSRKIICGYSDITSLHMAILHYSGLATLYGPMVVPVFGEDPPLHYAVDSFLQAVSGKQRAPYTLTPPHEYSDQFIDATKPDWRAVRREWKPNEGWRVLSAGKATAEVIVADLETLLANAGTPHFPKLKGRILIIEEMDAPFSKEERNLRHLHMIGAFDHIVGLIISKPFSQHNQGAPFSYDELIKEVVQKKPFPIISNFDAGHTFPMISIAQRQRVTLDAEFAGKATITMLNAATEIEG